MTHSWVSLMLRHNLKMIFLRHKPLKEVWPIWLELGVKGIAGAKCFVDLLFPTVECVCEDKGWCRLMEMFGF